MALYINTNVYSLNSQRKLTNITGKLSTSFERLSSGLRINRSKDDAAGLSISNRMTAQIRGLNQAVRNTNDAISMVQVAEGALDETTNSLQRIRELAVQAASDMMMSGDREDIWNEIEQLVTEIGRVSSNTKFNTMQMLGESTGSYEIKFQIGENAFQTYDLTVMNAGASALGVHASNIGTAFSMGGGSAAATGMTMASAQVRATSVLSMVDSALDSVSDIRALLGASQSRFESIVANLSNVSENTSAARSRILDADIAQETSTLTRNSIMQQASTAILAQANQQPQLALQLLG
ncbi:MAG: flagellin FliC [Magnetococcales bacterium]|nr:flagellin FliC [Magnetococcales bacterium]